MSATLSVTRTCQMPDGSVLVGGTMTFDNLYATGGETLNISSYMLSTCTPLVMLSGDDGYIPQSDRGTAAAGKVLLYNETAGANATVLAQAAANTNCAAVVVTFFAWGQTG